VFAIASFVVIAYWLMLRGAIQTWAHVRRRKNSVGFWQRASQKEGRAKALETIPNKNIATRRGKA
jgi:hypothetical protein